MTLHCLGGERMLDCDVEWEVAPLGTLEECLVDGLQLDLETRVNRLVKK